ALGNGNDGVLIYSNAQFNRIGTNGDGIADAAERNIISGNSQNGVQIQAAPSNIVAGNYIGTDVTGSFAIANLVNGVYILNAGSGNRIGTNGDGVDDVGERNVISGNTQNGVLISGGPLTALAS